MNRLNWIQQEQKIADYHVLTWRTSHFHHPRNRTDIVGKVGGKFDMYGGAASPGADKQPEGIGQGLSDPVRDARWTTGGLGAEGMADGGRKDAVHQEQMDTSDRTKGRRITGTSQSTATDQITAAAQIVVPEEMYSVISGGRSLALKLKERVKQGTAVLRERCHKQQKQTTHTAVLQETHRRQPREEQNGTRRCDKEDVLSMQAQNHYLLDSYDKNGRYSMLGR